MYMDMLDVTTLHFCFYINDLSDVLSGGKIQMYADDVQLECNRGIDDNKNLNVFFFQDQEELLSIRC